MKALTIDVVHLDVDVACSLVPGEKGFALRLVASRRRTGASSHFAAEFASATEAAKKLDENAGKHAMAFCMVLEIPGVGGLTQTFKSFAEIIREGSPASHQAQLKANAPKAIPCTETPSQKDAFMFQGGEYTAFPR